MLGASPSSSSLLSLCSLIRLTLLSFRDFLKLFFLLLGGGVDEVDEPSELLGISNFLKLK